MKATARSLAFLALDAWVLMLMLGILHVGISVIPAASYADAVCVIIAARSLLPSSTTKGGDK